MKIAKNENKGEFADFSKFTLYMISKILHEDSHYRYGHFRKNPRIHPRYHFCDFPLQMTFRLGNLNFEISRNSAYHWSDADCNMSELQCTVYRLLIAVKDSNRDYDFWLVGPEV